MNLPNRLSLFRILLVPAFIFTMELWTDARAWCRWLVFFIFSLACITDALDGYLARRLNQRTRLGSILDPLADKLLLVSAFLTLTFMPNIPDTARMPPGMTTLIISRDVLLVLGMIVIFMMHGNFQSKTNQLGKVTTFFQMALIATLLLGLPPGIRMIMMACVAVLTAVSSIVYIRKGIQLLSPGDANGF